MNSRALSRPLLRDLSRPLVRVATFSPLDIANVGAWYDPKDESTVAEAAGSISQLDDKSGNGRHISQAAGANQPTYTAAKSVSFDGNDYLGNSTPFMQAAGECTVFMVAENMVTAGAQVTEGRTASNTPFFVPVSYDGSSVSGTRFLNRDNASNINIIPLGGTFYDGSTRNILTTHDSGVELNCYQNGGITPESPVTYTRGGVTTLNTFNVGALKRTSMVDFSTFDLLELIIYERALTPSEMDSIGSYLATKWGLTWVNHVIPPSGLTGLNLWLDASDAATITEASGSVSQWDDKSGNGNHATQGTGAYQPTTGVSTVNGLNVLEFDEDFLSLSPKVDFRSIIFVTNNAEVGTAVVAAAMCGYGGDYTFIRTNDVDTSYDISIDGSVGRLGSVSVNGEGFVHGSNIDLGRTDAQNKGKNIWMIKMDGLISADLLGAFNSYKYTGEFLEIIASDTVLSDAEFHGIHNHLSNKWGI